MKLNLFGYLINSLISAVILRTVNAAPVNTIKPITDLKEISNFTDTSKANISMVNEKIKDDLQVAENRENEVKGMKMFGQPIHQGSTLDMKTKQISLETSSTNKIRKMQIPIPKAGEIQPRAGVVELTISVPRFKTDNMGNWVYNPWAATFGDEFRDTRFNFGTVTIPRMLVESRINKHYYPNKERLSTVCIDRSSPYNEPGILKWLDVHMYSKIRNLKFMKDLRRDIFENGRALECHTKKYTTFFPYIQCAMFRHQRMEYLIPYYPRIQNMPPNFEK